MKYVKSLLYAVLYKNSLQEIYYQTKDKKK